jgi:oligopeptidase B
LAFRCLLVSNGVATPIRTEAPSAPRVDRELRHGATVIDDYFWLREKSNPKVAQYLEAENAYTSA